MCAGRGGGFDGIYDKRVSSDQLLPAHRNELHRGTAYSDPVDLGRWRL